jgi:hypothetical protein
MCLCRYFKCRSFVSLLLLISTERCHALLCNSFFSRGQLFFLHNRSFFFSRPASAIQNAIAGRLHLFMLSLHTEQAEISVGFIWFEISESLHPQDPRASKAMSVPWAPVAPPASPFPSTSRPRPAVPNRSPAAPHPAPLASKLPQGLPP